MALYFTSITLLKVSITSIFSWSQKKNAPDLRGRSEGEDIVFMLIQSMYGPSTVIAGRYSSRLKG